jgi:hypothetical protein
MVGIGTDAMMPGATVTLPVPSRSSLAKGRPTSASSSTRPLAVP